MLSCSPTSDHYICHGPLAIAPPSQLRQFLLVRHLLPLPLVECSLQCLNLGVLLLQHKRQVGRRRILEGGACKGILEGVHVADVTPLYQKPLKIKLSYFLTISLADPKELVEDPLKCRALEVCSPVPLWYGEEAGEEAEREGTPTEQILGEW